jgi:hypothetical protein
MTAEAITFPALGIGRDVGRFARADREDVVCFPDEKGFLICEAWDLKHESRIGMLLIDSTGRNWTIRGVRSRGLAGPLWRRVLLFVFRQSEYFVDHELVEETPLSFDAVKHRVCASIDANPDTWRNDEAIAGESGPPREEQELYDELKARVRAAKDLGELVEVLENPHEGQ